LAEALQVIKGCWSGTEYEFAGDHYRVELTGSPTPVQRPHPPVLLGAAGPRMLRLAAREADIVGITVTRGLAGFETFARAVSTAGERIPGQLEVVRDAAGDRFTSLELSVMIHLFAQSTDGLRALAAEVDVRMDLILESPHVLAGPPERAAEVLRERRERLGISYVVIRGADFELAEPVVRRLSGS
jgi:alkanesulfonate monooxygenase SsuD/methylene tetrahydromethanopterin reductase-like flavin-dependent oxidoreductase (luciferase family)